MDTERFHDNRIFKVHQREANGFTMLSLLWLPQGGEGGTQWEQKVMRLTDAEIAVLYKVLKERMEARF